MSNQHPPDYADHIYRVDKFIVPAEARDEFLHNVRNTHEILRAQPGFVRDLILEQVSGPGSFNLLTLVEWESAVAIEGAKAAVHAVHARTNFNPQETMARLGIQADLANYQQIALPVRSA